MSPGSGCAEYVALLKMDSYAGIWIIYVLSIGVMLVIIGNYIREGGGVISFIATKTANPIATTRASEHLSHVF
jgi:hypothetical protein